MDFIIGKAKVVIYPHKSPIYCATVIQWYSDTVIQWYSDTVIQWYSDTVIQWYSDTVIQWYSDTVRRWHVLVLHLFIGTQFIIGPYTIINWNGRHQIRQPQYVLVTRLFSCYKLHLSGVYSTYGIFYVYTHMVYTVHTVYSTYIHSTMNWNGRVTFGSAIHRIFLSNKPQKKQCFKKWSSVYSVL